MLSMRVRATVHQHDMLPGPHPQGAIITHLLVPTSAPANVKITLPVLPTFDLERIVFEVQALDFGIRRHRVNPLLAPRAEHQQVGFLWHTSRVVDFLTDQQEDAVLAALVLDVNQDWWRDCIQIPDVMRDVLVVPLVLAGVEVDRDDGVGVQVVAGALEAAEHARADNLPAAARALNDQVNPALNAMLRESGALLQRERQRVEEQLVAAQSLFERVALWVGVASLLGVALAALVAWRTTRSVVAPLARLETAALQIAQGDYRHRMPDTGTQEVDRVGQALNTMADAVAQREQQIVRLAYQDSLTGLPNRTALLYPQHPVPEGYNALLLMDLARLKAINETLGFATGDTLIKELATRSQAVLQIAMVRGWVGPHGVVARLAGGSFAMAVRSATVLALRPPSWPSTAITRHSGILRPKRELYSAAIRSLTAFEVIDSR